MFLGSRNSDSHTFISIKSGALAIFKPLLLGRPCLSPYLCFIPESLNGFRLNLQFGGLHQNLSSEFNFASDRPVVACYLLYMNPSKTDFLFVAESS
jgi:hypothetical protein